ncbi:dTDP-glucose 4,6-dehydratase [Maribacter caenipelagi]|uniref:dTDP-glucose 4,6-dehydratase n=2 Tax=Maribacter caenipelagi TaxID=1447781 RepID=A0A4R7DF64_9FLAO|nr:dTDP-glucose 4,6-dehydratase [Maribacter caenipelagi]
MPLKEKKKPTRIIMKKILITGAAGFLGSHLCDRFIAEGFHVIGMDNLITGDLNNIAYLFPLEHFEFHHHDVTKFVHVSGKLDYILHFASPASPIDYLKIPIKTLKVGSLGTLNLLGLAKEKGARILVASTSEVYGDPLVHPQNEEYFGNVNPIGPRGVYDEAKRFMESITMAYHRHHGLDTRIVRIFNTYGPRMRLNDGRVVPAFMGQALRGEDLTVFGDGSQSRSFCYIDDQVEGIYRLLFSDYTNPVNIGNPHETTIKEFAEEIIALTGTKQKIIYKPLPQDDPTQRQPDITKAKEILGWEPKVHRTEGLKIVYDYFKSLSPEDLQKKEHRNFSTK